MKKILISLTCVISIVLSGCYYDNQEALYPSIEVCKSDSATLTYTNKIAPILKENCLSCHSNATKALGGNIALESYDNVVTYAEEILLDVKQESGTDFNPMPKGSSQKISDCNIQLIEDWIKYNAPE